MSRAPLQTFRSPLDSGNVGFARQRFGRIAIANSDADAACKDQAIDQAFRAVQELLSV